MEICVLIASQRSGTNYLRALLAGHPALHTDSGEVFDVHDDRVSRSDNFWNYVSARIAGDPRAWMPSNRPAMVEDFFRFLSDRSDGRTTIVDIKYNSLHHGNPAWTGVLAVLPLLLQIGRLELPVLHLIRKNSLRMLVSRKRADAAKQYALRSEDRNATWPVRLDPSTLLHEITYHQNEMHHISEILRRCCCVMEVEYNDLWTDHPGGTRNLDVEEKLQRHLGVNPIPLPPPTLLKMTPHDLSNALSNWEEVQQVLSNSPYAWMLNE